MKDKELRTLLEEKGIIDIGARHGSLRPRSWGFEVRDIEQIRGVMRGLQDQLDAINKHYGITVEKPADEYVVTVNQ